MNIEPSIQIVRAAAESLAEVAGITKDLQLSVWSISDYAAELERDDSVFIVAIDGELSVAGFVVGRIIPSSSSSVNKEAEIYNIGVRTQLKRTGIGTALIQNFLAQSRAYGATVAWLEVRSANVDAIKFYERGGFEAVGDRKNYYNDPVDDAIIMRTTV